MFFRSVPACMKSSYYYFNTWMCVCVCAVSFWDPWAAGLMKSFRSWLWRRPLGRRFNRRWNEGAWAWETRCRKQRKAECETVTDWGWKTKIEAECEMSHEQSRTEEEGTIAAWQQWRKRAGFDKNIKTGPETLFSTSPFSLRLHLISSLQLFLLRVSAQLRDAATAVFQLNIVSAHGSTLLFQNDCTSPWQAETWNSSLSLSSSGFWSRKIDPMCF